MARRRLNLGQRVVVIVSFGATLAVVGSWLTADGVLDGTDLVSPFYVGVNGSVSSSGAFPNTNGHLLIWLVLIALWTTVSMVLLRGRSVSSARGRVDGAAPGHDD